MFSTLSGTRTRYFDPQAVHDEQLTDKAAKHLKEVLQNENCLLTKRDLRFNQFTDEDAKHLKEAQENKNHNLKELILIGNKFAGQGEKILKETAKAIGNAIWLLNQFRYDQLPGGGKASRQIPRSPISLIVDRFSRNFPASLFPNPKRILNQNALLCKVEKQTNRPNFSSPKRHAACWIINDEDEEFQSRISLIGGLWGSQPRTVGTGERQFDATTPR